MYHTLRNEFAFSHRMKKVLRAFDNKDFGLLTLLISQKCFDPNKILRDKGVTLFHLIIGHQSENFAFKVTKLFLRYGADPNVASEDGVTPLHVAAAWGRTRILHLLLVNGGDPWLQDDDRKNAFNYAFEEQEWDAVEMLHHFQQMHTSASCRSKIEHLPNLEFNYERILLQKGEEVLDSGVTKNANTQTITASRNSPEPGPEIGWKGQDAIGWSPDFYHTTCELSVNPEKDPSVICINDSDSDADEGSKRKARHYVSSIHIDTTPLKTEELRQGSVIDKPSTNSLPKSPGDVRSQLFLELQEAVLRRSKQKLNSESLASVVEASPPSARLVDDSFVANEISYLYGVNLTNNSLLRHMSDFATKVMKEIELTESELDRVNTSEKPRTTLNSTYLTCEEESGFRDEVDCEDCKLTEGHQLANLRASNTFDTSNESFLSVAEESRQGDAEEGVAAEKKLLLTPTVSSAQDTIVVDSDSEASTRASNASSVPSSVNYASDTLRTELTKFGCKPGPITKTTKRLYLKKLRRLRRTYEGRVYSSLLAQTTRSQSRFDKILSYAGLEEEMMRVFDERKRKWREGSSKTSFNYLLLDPRLSSNLPRRASTMDDLEIWTTFLSSVFYVGKGKRSRPYGHLFEAASFWRRKCDTSLCNRKVQRILEIWSADLGVVCLHVFQNVLPVEAFTREAAMIDALGAAALENVKGGEYYGSPASWTNRDRIKLGIYSLYKAMLIFLSEGERQIKPFDIS